jgi:MFS family permease
MFAYPAVFLPALWFSIAQMTEVANTAGFALNFGPASRYHFNTREIGFCSFSGLIGAVIGEMMAGPICDFVAKRHLRKGGDWKPEQILPIAATGLVLVSAGLLLYGLELEFPTGWAAALTGIGIFTAGQEILLTVLMTYTCDCYPDKASEVSIVFQCCINVQAYHPP